MKANVLRIAALLVCTIFWVSRATGQNWTWLAGDSSGNQNSVYGTLGVESAANKPGGRFGAAMWSDAAGNVWVFGGLGTYGSSDGYMNDMWKYTAATGKWTWMGGSNGINQAGVYGTKGIASAANIPGARFGASYWKDNAGNFWLFGGDGATPTNSGFLNDLWKYNIATGLWTWVSGGNQFGTGSVHGTINVANAANAPGGRAKCYVWSDAAGNFWLYGGVGSSTSGTAVGGNGDLSDLWKYNVTSGLWTWVGGNTVLNAAGVFGTQGVSAASNKPGAKSEGAAWTDGSGNLWMYGGYGYASSTIRGSTGDLWKYNISTGQWTWMNGSNQINQTAVYGTLGVASPTNTPGARSGFSSWSDNSGNFIVFGALENPGYQNDLWKYDLAANQWTWIGGSSSADQHGNYGTPGVYTSSNMPGSRGMSSVTKDDAGNVRMFGGYGYAASGSTGRLNDLWVSRQPAGALRFDGSDDKVVFPANSDFNINSGTVELWVNGASSSFNQCMIAVRDPSATRWSAHINYGQQTIGIWNGISFHTVAVSVTPGVWYHIALVLSPTNVAVYVNGTLAGNTNNGANIISTNLPLVLGAAHSTASGVENFNGTIDEVRLWNRQLCAAEIANNMNCELSLPQNGLVGYFKLNQGEVGSNNTTVTDVADATGIAGHTGTPVNMALTGTTSNWVAGKVGGSCALYSGSLNAGADQQFCSGNSVTLTATGGNGSYTWSNGVVNGVAFTPSATTTYAVSSGSGGCTLTDQVVVAMKPFPDLQAGGNQTVCAGMPVVLTATGAASYSWSNAVVNGVAFIPSASQTYSVTGTGANGCSISDIVTVFVEPNPLPVPDLTGPGGVTPGSTITLSSSIAGGIWSSDNAAVATVNSSGVVTGVALGQATISYKISGGACSRTVTKPVTVGNPGGALHLDGANDKISVPYSSDFYFASGTVEFWMKPAAGNVAQCPVAIRSTAGTRWSVHVNENLNTIGIWNGNTYSTVSVNIAPDTWYHVALSMTTSSVAVYVNGTLAGNTTNGISASVNGLGLVIGSTNPLNTNAENFQGTLDEIRIWNRQLCAAEIANNMNCELSLPQSGLVAYYKLNQGIIGADNSSFADVTDASGNGHDGQLLFAALSGTTSNWVAGKATGTCGLYSGTLNAGPDQQVCPGNGVTLTATGGNGSYAWSDGIVNGVAFIPSASTTYTVFSQAAGCVLTDRVIVTIKPTPNLSVGNDQIVCAGTPVVLTASGAVSYSWDKGVVNGVTFTPSVSQIYTVTGTGANGCSISAVVGVFVEPNPLPVPDPIDGPSQVMPANTIALSDSTPGGVWSSDNIAVATVDVSGVVTGVTPGLATISYKITSGPCSRTVTKLVTVGTLAGALHFDGINDNLVVPYSSDFYFTSGTVEFWMKPGAGSLASCPIAVRSQTSTRWSVHVNEGDNTIGIWNGTTYKTVPVNIVPNTWYHVALNMSTSNVAVFVNGNFAGNTLNGINTSVPGLGLVIGSTDPVSTNAENFLGSIDEVRLWNRRLCPGEIVNNMNCELPLPQTGLVAYYKMNQGIVGANNGAYASVADASGNGHGGTLMFAALSGATSNWVAGQVGNTSCSAYIGSLNPGASQQACQGSPVTLTATGGGTSYTWSNGVINGVPFTPSASGTYAVSSDSAGCILTGQVVVNLLPLPSVNAGPDQSVCSGGTAVLSGSGASGYSWNNGVTNGTPFVATISKTYTVTGTDGNGCTNKDSALVTVTPNLLLLDTISGPSQVTYGNTILLADATAGGSWSSSNPDVATINATGLVSGISGGVDTISYTISDGYCSKTVSKAITVIQPAGALHFDGVNDKAIIPFSNALYFENGTVELWVKPSASSVQQCPIAIRSGSATRWSIHINEAQNTIGIWNGISFKTVTANIVPDTWYHIALVMSTNDIAVYVNGSFIANTGNGINPSVPSLKLIIGAPDDLSNGAENFKGMIDEVRIWDRQLCAAEIGNNMNCELSLPQTGLIACYRFNQGISGQNNTAFSTLQDATGNGHDGALTGLALNGWSSNWLNGHVTGICPSFSNPVAVPDSITGPAQVLPGNTITLADATPGGIWSSGNTGIAMVNSTGVVTGIAAGVTTISYTISNGGCTRAVSRSITVGQPGGSLSFHNYADRVLFNNDAGFDFTSGTIEFWMKPEAGLFNQTIIAAGNGYEISWRIQVNESQNTVGVFKLATLSNYTLGTVPVNIVPDTWYHIAVVIDANDASVYVNGVFAGNTGNGLLPGLPNVKIVVGAPADYISGGGDYKGSLDELRIWNRKLCASEISNNMSCELTLPQNGLVAYYPFNQGAVGGINSSVNRLWDVTGNGHHGTLTNLALTGLVSNWVAGQVTGACTYVAQSVNAGPDQQACASANVTLAASGGSGNYTWSNGVINGTPFTPSATATYTVIDNVFDCLAPDQVTVTVNPLPAITPVTGPSALTIGNTITLLNSTPGGTWMSNTPGVASVSPAGLVTGVAAGTATISYTVSNGQCSTSVSKVIAVSTPAGAFKFDGVDDKAYISYANEFGFSTGTLEAWVKPMSGSLNKCIAANQPLFGSGWSAHINEAQNTIGFWNGSTFNTISVNIVPDTWYHIALVFDPGNVYVYVDGVFKGATGNGPNPTFSGSFIIGSTGYGTIGGENFLGTMDEVRIWNRKLCVSEITNNMNCELAGPQAGLVGYYKFNQGILGGDNSSITYVNDASGNGYGLNITSSTDTTLSGWVAGRVSGTCAPYSQPTINAGPDIAVCIGSSVTLNATGGTTYTWDNGVINGVPFTPFTTATYRVTSGSGGCLSDEVTVTVNPLPYVSAGDYSMDVCYGEEVVLSGSGASSYSWDHGVSDGVGFYPPITTSIYTVIGTDSNGCSNIADVWISVHLPWVDAGPDQYECWGNPVTLNAMGAYTYTWSDGVLNGVEFIPTRGGTFSVVGTDEYGCMNYDDVNVFLEHAPEVNAGPDRVICAGSSVTLNGSGASSYFWDNGIGNGVAFTPGSTATYTVIGSVWPGCTNTDQVTVTVVPPPTVNPIAGPSVVGNGNTIVLTDGTPGGVWSSSNPAVATVTASGTVTGVALGTATINYTVSNGACSTSASKVITVSPGAGAAKFDGVWDRAFVSYATDMGFSSGTVEAWVKTVSGTDVCVVANKIPFGTGWALFINEPQNAIKVWNGTSYNTVTANIVTDTWYHIAMVYSPSNADIYVDGVFAGATGTGVSPLNNAAFFIGSTEMSGTGWSNFKGSMDEVRLWNRQLCPGEIANNMNCELPLPQSGLVAYYKFNQGVAGGTDNTINTLDDVSGNGHSATIATMGSGFNWVAGHVTSTCSPYSPASLSVGPDQQVCAGNSVTLTASGGGSSYTWDNGVNNGVPFTPSATTTYHVTSGSGSCTLSGQVTVTVKPKPTVNAGTDQTVCAGATVTLSGSGAGSYTWDNSVSNGVSFTPASTKTYTVTGTGANGCSNTDQVSVTVNPLPPVNAGIDQTVCAGTSVILSGSGANSYSWSNSVSNSIAFVPSLTATYTVTGTDGNGCINTDQAVVTVNAVPAVNAGADQTVCAGTAVSLNGSGASSYSWDHSVSDGIAFTPPATTTYSVTGTDGNGCSNTDQVVVTVNPLPVVNAGIDKEVCSGLSVILTGSGAATYSWDNAVTNGAAFNPASTTTYTVTGTDGNGCTSTDQTIVTVHPNPAATASHTDASCFAVADGTVSVSLTGGTSPYSYLWDDPAASASSSVSGLLAGTYHVTATDIYGCVSNASTTIGQSAALPAPTVSIDPVKLCPGYSPVLSATAANAGSTPSYQWTDNGTPVGSNSNSYTGILQAGHSIRCQVTSSDPCSPVSTALSAAVTVPSTPTTQANTLNFPSVTANLIKINFKRGSGNGGVLIVASKDAAPNTDPDCGLAYTAPTTSAVDFSDPTLIALGNGKVVYKNTTNVAGTSLNLNLSNLAAGRYYFKIYEYDNTANGPVYLKPAAQADTVVILPQPSAGVSNITISSVFSDHATISWTNGNGTGRLVILTPDNVESPVPTINTFYPGSSTYPLGTFVLGQSYSVYAGTGNSVTVDGLQPLVKYTVWIAEYNDDGTNIRYRTQVKKTFRTTADHFSLTQTGVEYFQDFDSLSTAADGELAPGKWQFVESGTNADFFYQPSDGNISGTGVYSFGTDGDRAFGSVVGGGITADLGIRIKNLSSDTITSLLVSYTGEQWYRGGVTGTADQLRFLYSTTTNALTGSGFTRIPALDFLSPVTTGSGPLDGNAPANRTKISRSITGLYILPGENIWIKFTDLNTTSGNDGLAIDDLSFIAFSTTVEGGGNITATKLNNLNVVGGVATSQATCLNIKKAFNMEQGGTLDISGTAAAKHSVSLCGPIYGTGTITSNEYSGVTVGGQSLGQTLYFTPGSKLLTLTVSSKAVANLGNDVRIGASPKGQAKVGGAQPATLNTNGHLILESDSTGSGTVAVCNGPINGNVTVERFMQYRDALRLVAHPFSTAITPAQVNDDMLVNTTSGSENLWWYDASTATPGSLAGLVSSSSWTPVGSLGFNWQPYQGLRLSKSAGQANVDMDGPLNQGNITIPLNWGPDSFLVIGNPYASTLKLGNALGVATAAGVVNGAAIYTWNPALGTNGAFVTVPNNKFATFKLPANGVFIATTGGTSGSLSFSESDKCAAIATMTYFRPDGEEEELEVPAEEDAQPELPDGLKLTILKEGVYQDAAYVYFSESSEANRERTDAPKISNPGLDLYAKSVDGFRLALDQRPFEKGARIPLGLEKAQGSYAIAVSEWNLPAGAKLYLEDHLTGSEAELHGNSVYKFVSDDKGEGRFFLRMDGAISSFATQSMKLIPNPARDQVSIILKAKASGKGNVRILSLAGHELLRSDISLEKEDRITIPVNALAPGTYLVELNLGELKSVQKLIKD